ncbi:hypothetical protein Q7P37_004788 [Cladosporium fusiforme]
MVLPHFATLLVASILPLLFAVVSGQDDTSWVPFDRQDFNGSIALDEDGDVQLYWKTGDNYSTYGIASRSSGYLALGFSETGAMTGADIALGYNNDDNEFVFENRHAAGFVTPQMSQDQDDNMRFKEGHQADGVTSFTFEKRNKAGCVQNQVDVNTDAWQWFIYSFSDENTFAQHGPGDNGKKYVKLGDGKTVSVNEVLPIKQSKEFSIIQPEVTVPAAETTYCYSLHKMPSGKRNFLLGEQPHNSSKVLHHLVLYACYNLDDKYLDMLDQPTECGEFSNPCNGFVTEWAPGMSGRTFEEGYGKPFGEDLYEYVMFETHYNNPELIEGHKESAGYTLLYDDKQVDTEIGTLTLGDLQVTGWFLEPGQELTSRSTVCTPECTEHWPSEGITAISVFHHMHFRGRNTRVQIIRDGKEIAPLSTLRSFEYGNQFSKALDEIKLLPGDQLITTCEYDTSNDTEPVPGGPASSDEMCFAWVDYYPANSVLACTQIDMSSVPQSPINGTAAMCVQSTEQEPDIYPSKFLTSAYENFTISGDTCPASGNNGTSDPSGGAAVLSTCPESEVCFALHVPEQSVSSGSGDIFFQLSAPTSYSWVALAQGTMMSNANMFLMYSSADGSDVTLSPRNAPGHQMPTHNDAADITILDGSGISNGRMTANVRCGNCTQWSTGTLDLQGSNSDWVYAYQQGSQIDSDDTNAIITQHDRTGSFQWDLSRATGGTGTNESNPFTNAATTDTSSTGRQMMSQAAKNNYIRAHGSLAAIAFVFIFPLGAILIRLASFRLLAWTHGGLQIFGYALFTAAAGLGIWMANAGGALTEPHAIIGMLLFAILFFMPFLGVIHHKIYKQVQKRTAWSYIHIFTGRAAILLGMVNGGLGLRLAEAPEGALIAYGVLVGIVGLVYIAAVVFGTVRTGRRNQPVAQKS